MNQTEARPEPENEEARAFGRLVQGADAELDLARAALEIGRIVEPQLNAERYVARLDALAVEVCADLSADAEPREIAGRVTQVLFVERAFRGDRDDYYNPLNSCLHAVLERRRGLPILLSVIFLEVAARAGLEVDGVGAPSHFVVKYHDAGQVHFLDPFHEGEEIPAEDLRTRIEQALAGTQLSPDAFLERVTRRQILSRILHNLKGCCIRRGDLEGALACTDYLLAFAPWSLDEVRERGLLLYRLGRHRESLGHLKRYREHASGAAQSEQIEQLIRQLEARLADP